MQKQLGRSFLVITALFVLVGLSSGCTSLEAASISSNQQTTVTSQIITETPVPVETNPSDTHTATLPPATATPVTKYNTTSFVREGTEIPLPQEIISSENISQITELARWGYGSINQIEYAPDASLMLVQTDLGVYAYKTGTLNEIWRFEVPAGASSMALSPDSQSVAVGTHDGMILFISLESGEIIYELTANGNEITSLEFSNNGSFLASGSVYGDAAVWEIRENETQQITEFAVSEFEISKLNFTSQDNLLVIHSWSDDYGSGTLFFLNLLDNKLLDHIEEATPYHSFYDSNEFILVDDQITHTGKKILFSQLDHGENFGNDNARALSSDGKFLAVGYVDGSARVFRVEDGQLLNILNANPEAKSVKLHLASPAITSGLDPTVIISIAISPDNKYLAMKNSLGLIEIWDLTSNSLTGRVNSFGSQLQFSLGGKSIVSYDSNFMEIIQMPYGQKTGYH